MLQINASCSESGLRDFPQRRRRRRIRRLTVFKMAAVRHLGFLKFKLSDGRSG